LPILYQPGLAFGLIAVIMKEMTPAANQVRSSVVVLIGVIIITPGVAVPVHPV
jgi:uncharacterized membrane protein YczE